MFLNYLQEFIRRMLVLSKVKNNKYVIIHHSLVHLSSLIEFNDQYYLLFISRNIPSPTNLQERTTQRTYTCTFLLNITNGRTGSRTNASHGRGTSVGTHGCETSATDKSQSRNSSPSKTYTCTILLNITNG